MTAEEAAALLESVGAIIRGHFKLSSGRHSDVYVEKARVLEQPEPTVALAREIASWYPEIDVVVSPAVGAIVFGFAVALEAGARSIFTEREDGRMQLRRGFAVRRGERVLVVEDVITTGGSAREVYDLVGEYPAERLGVAALVDRSAQPLRFPLRAILHIEATSWPEDECALCRSGRPLESPGSRYLNPPA